MSATHTQGPWHWDSDVVKNDPTGRVRYRVCAIGKTVTQVYYSSYEGGLTNAEADARLIAEAPAMRLALELIAAGVAEMVDDPAHRQFVFMPGKPQQRVADCRNGDWDNVITAIGWDRCREALAKARGE